MTDTPLASPEHAMERLAESDHEQVVFCRHQPSGLRAIIAIHSTALGPALGGTRFYPYASESEALADVLDLARGMTYKNALAELDHGGGKAVIIGDPHRDKSEALLRAYGRFVESLGGRYVTACDVGTYVTDMDMLARESRWVTGRSPAEGGAGDSSVLTAYGVFQGMRACAEVRWGQASLRGRRVGISGVGKVGSKLAAHLLEDGAEVVVTDISPEAVSTVTDDLPRVEVAPDQDQLLRSKIDILSPCALGHMIDDDVVAGLAQDGTCQVICGAANNQLATPDMAEKVDAAGILYAPDYLVNCGGVIQVADELHGYSESRARNRAQQIQDTTAAVLSRAMREGVTPDAAANRLAEQRVEAICGLNNILLPRS